MLDKCVKFLLLWLSIFFFQLGIWLLRKFGDISFSQFLFHADMGIEGLMNSDTRLIGSFIRKCLLVPTGIIVFIYFLLKYHRPAILRIPSNIYLTGLLVLSFSLFLHKVAFFEAVVSYLHYFQTGEDYFSTHYVNPNTVQIKAPRHYKNLVLIYVESLEETYSDSRLFTHNLIQSIEPQTVNHAYRFAQYEQAPGTGWTIAGIVSTQCGLPLRTLIRNRMGNSQSGFLNNAVCLGDILKNQGYKNIFINGPDLAFSGMGLFVKTHGYDEAYGRLEWYRENKTKDDMNDWGLYDDLLFVEAEKKIDELESHQNEPFNLTLLTIDTHGPKGFVSKHCAMQHHVTQDNFEGIVECTALQVKDFITYIQEKGYLKNTLIVIFGDHLAMKNPVYGKLLNAQHRHIFNLFVKQGQLTPNREAITEFDMFPTILNALEFNVEGGQLGLGYSGFSEGEYKPNDVYYQEMQQKLLGYSPSYANLW